MSGRRPVPAAAAVATRALGDAGRGAANSLPGVLDLLLLEKGGGGLSRVKVKHSQESTPTAQVVQPSPVGSSILFDMDLGTPGDAEARHGTSRRVHGVATPGHPTNINAAAALAATDRSFSDLDQYKTIKAACGITEVDQLIQLCCPTTDIELAVAEHLRHVRSLPRAVAMDTEDLAAELLAMGLLVQVRKGVGSSDAAAGRSTRDCLRTLRHTFMVCTGYQRGTTGEPVLFREPLVVEPRFKEQFLIAHPTPAYEELLQVLPISFVGSCRRLEAAVRLLAEQIALAFKQAGRALPPWRSAEAMLSKWAPSQLTELARLLRAAGHTQHQAAVKASAVLHQLPPADPVQSAFAGQAAHPVLEPINTGHQPGTEAGQQGMSKETLQALDMVRSMSRQMSHSGMCARSLPETHAARLRAESLRRLLCGLGAAPCQLSPTLRTSTTGCPAGSQQGTFVISSQAAADSTRDSTAAAAITSPGLGDVKVLSFGQHRSTNTSASNLVDKLQTSGRVSAPGALPPQQQITSPGSAKAHRPSPFSQGLPNATDQSLCRDMPDKIGPAAAAAPQPLTTASPTLVRAAQVAGIMQRQPDASTEPVLASRAVSYMPDAAAVQPVGDAVASAHVSNQPGLMSHVSAPPVTLTITRQSSTEIKRALKQERTSALAAALRASPHPSGSVSHIPAKDAVMRVSSPAFTTGGVVGQGAAGVMRAVYEEVWPPKITTVKWGAAGQVPQ